MEHQTRQLLRILADDLVDDIVAELSGGELLETDLQRRIAGSRQTIGRRLGELESWGIAVGEDRQTPGRGRPTRAWRLATPAVSAFLDDADEFLLRLLENRVNRHREAICPARDKGRVRRLHPRS
jgi:predicted ArsR family transcriptional regulator